MEEEQQEEMGGEEMGLEEEGEEGQFGFRPFEEDVDVSTHRGLIGRAHAGRPAIS